MTRPAWFPADRGSTNVGRFMSSNDIDTIVDEIRQTTNHAAQALQVVRRAMGDVHGTKPALTRIAYDTIKWASAICGLLEDAA